jgi:hypothetical protein
MLSPGEGRPGEDVQDSAAEHLFRTITRLVANSGIQFIDFQIPRHIADSVSRVFVEERVMLGDETVWALAPVHSATAMPADTTDVLRVDGRQALNAVMNQWVPLPLLRFVARDGSGQARFDDGPYNWARMYLSTDTSSTDHMIRGVIALDTQIEPTSRLDLAAYTCPTLDDVRFGSTFAATDDAERLAPFLAEDWLQGWLQSVFPPAVPANRSGAPPSAALLPIASYLTVLSVLRRAAVLPSLQFFESRPDVVPAVPVDLVLDIGASRSCAMLVESASEHGRPMMASSAMLTLRDLSRPTFGREAWSRKSGRPDAFNWPSLARTGPEAVRLSCGTHAADGATSMTSPKTYLRDVAPRDEAWRFMADPSARIRRSQMLAGRMLTHVNPTAGLLSGPNGAAQSVALRPRYSLSAMMSFLIAEVISQALAVINAPVVSADVGLDETLVNPRSDGVRQLRQIVICAPLTMPLEERDLLRERADAAIDMLWRALDWDNQPLELAPPRPVVRLGLDETLSAQLVFLFDEISKRFAGEPRAFLDVMGKSRPEFGIQPCIRLGALDIGGGHANMTIVTYASSGDAPIGPKLLGAQRSNIGGDAMVDRIIGDLIWPALTQALAAAGVADAEVFLSRHVAVNDAAYDVTSLPQRLQDYWLRPAAIALLQLATGLTAHTAPAPLALSLRDLAHHSATPNPHVAAELAELARGAGAGHFSLDEVRLTLRLNQISASASAALAPMIGNLSRAIVASDCDVVLLTGWAGRLRVVKDLLLEAMPWRPDRIIALHARDWQDWYPMPETERAAADGKDIGLIGALLALAGGERLGFGSGESGFPFTPGSFGDEPAAGSTDGWQSAAARRGRP